jgi:hypothetical protein
VATRQPSFQMDAFSSREEVIMMEAHCRQPKSTHSVPCRRWLDFSEGALANTLLKSMRSCCDRSVSKP